MHFFEIQLIGLILLWTILGGTPYMNDDLKVSGKLKLFKAVTTTLQLNLYKVHSNN